MNRGSRALLPPLRGTRERFGKENRGTDVRSIRQCIAVHSACVDDYQKNDPRRALSAVRNFHAGLTLLTKEVLVRVTPNAEESEIVATCYKPVPDGSGGIKYEAALEQTVDVDAIGRRFKDFGLSIDQTALKNLSQILNDVEHRYSKEPHNAVR